MWFKGGFGVQPKSGVFKSIAQLQWSSITEVSISKQCSDILAQLIKDKFLFFLNCNYRNDRNDSANCVF